LDAGWGGGWKVWIEPQLDSGDAFPGQTRPLRFGPFADEGKLVFFLAPFTGKSAQRPERGQESPNERFPTNQRDVLLSAAG
jgi:hypothetical protein